MTDKPDIPPGGEALPLSADINWKRNLFYVWLAQFLSMVGFGFGMPFAAYYIQELGVRDDAEVKFWTAVFQSSAALTMALVGPLWGAISDRYGRKLMLLRANFGAAVILYAMGYAPDVWWLIALRLVQGALTGTVSAAQTLISVSTPNDRCGTALGMLSTAIFSGNMAGMFLGGLCGDACGYANTFKIGGGILLLSSLLVLFMVEERFTPPAVAAGEPQGRARRLMPHLGPGLPLLLIMFIVAVARRTDDPIIPLLIQHVNGAKEGAGTLVGLMGAAASVSSILSGVVMGRLVDRMPAPRVAKFSALGGAAFLLFMTAAESFGTLTAIRFCMMFCAGGLDPVFQVWLSRVTTEEKRGAVFGWALTAKSAAWFVAPLLGAAVAIGIPRLYAPVAGEGLEGLAAGLGGGRAEWFLFSRLAEAERLDLRAVFVLEAAVMLALLPLVGWATRKMAGGGDSRATPGKEPDGTQPEGL